MHFSVKNHVVVIFVRNIKLRKAKLSGMMKILRSLGRGNIRATKMPQLHKESNDMKR